MSVYDKLILTIVYMLVLTISVSWMFVNIKKNKKFRIVDFFNMFFVLIYFIVPILFFYNNSSKFINKYSSFLTYDIKYHVYSLIVAIVFFIIFNVSYNLTTRSFKNGPEVNINSKKFILINTIFSIAGIFSYYMWSKFYGFPFGILKYADALRDNRVSFNNPYTIFQPFCNFALFASYNWLLLIKYCKTILNKILSFMMFALTLSFSIIATLATDSRSATIIVFLVPILYMISYKKVNIKKTMIVGTIALVVLANLDSVTYYIRNKTQRTSSNSNNITDIIAYEFGFTYANRINLFYNLDNVDVKITELDDLEGIILAWVPKSMKPKDLISISRYNTQFFPNASGTIPPDVVTASIYKGRVIGLILLPIVLGIILKIVDGYFSIKQGVFYKMIFYYFAIAVNLRLVGYYDMGEILSSKFALIIYFVTIIVLCKVRIKKER